MRKAWWVANACLALTLCVPGCGKKQENLNASSASSVPSQDSAEQVEPPASETHAVIDDSGNYTNDIVTAAITMAKNMTVITDLRGKFAGYGSVEDIARRTNAKDNSLWEEFSKGKIYERIGYRTPYGDFVAMSAWTDGVTRIGLVVNLSNQKTALYHLGDRTISPAGEKLSSALATLLATEYMVNEALRSRRQPLDKNYQTTIVTLEGAISGLDDSQNQGQIDSGKQLPEPAHASDSVYADAVAAQRAAIETKQTKEQLKEQSSARRDEMKKRVISIFHTVYLDLKRAGIRTGDPREAINTANFHRRQQRIWELTIEPYGSDPNYVVVRDFLDPSGMFVVEGVASMYAEGKVRDDGYDVSGIFSHACMFEITDYRQKFNYPCMPFLEGKHDQEAFRALRDSVLAQIKQAAAQRSH